MTPQTKPVSIFPKAFRDWKILSVSEPVTFSPNADKTVYAYRFLSREHNIHIYRKKSDPSLFFVSCLGAMDERALQSQNIESALYEAEAHVLVFLQSVKKLIADLEI